MGRRRIARDVRERRREQRTALSREGKPVITTLPRGGLITAPEDQMRMECAHGKPIKQCALCSKEGEQYEVDRAIEEAAGGVEPEEWLDRAARFRRKAAQLRLSLGGRAKETRAARAAEKQCVMVAQALYEARKTRGAAPPAAPKPIIATPDEVRHGNQRSR